MGRRRNQTFLNPPCLLTQIVLDLFLDFKEWLFLNFCSHKTLIYLARPPSTVSSRTPINQTRLMYSIHHWIVYKPKSIKICHSAKPNKSLQFHSNLKFINVSQEHITNNRPIICHLTYHKIKFNKKNCIATRKCIWSEKKTKNWKFNKLWLFGEIIEWKKSRQTRLYFMRK